MGKGIYPGLGQGIDKQREATERFSFQHSVSAAIFLFSNTVRYYARVVHRVLSASCIVAMERRI